MTYRLELTRRAQTDRDQCFDFICEKIPRGALRWLEAFEHAASALLTEPHYGAAPESHNHAETIRQKFFRTRYGLTYRLLYILRGETIFVIHVRGANQDVMAEQEIELPEVSGES